MDVEMSTLFYVGRRTFGEFKLAVQTSLCLFIIAENETPHLRAEKKEGPEQLCKHARSSAATTRGARCFFLEYR